MDCAEEFRLIDSGLRQLPGIAELRPDYVARTVRVRHQPAQIERDGIDARLQAIGFPARPPDAEGAAGTASHFSWFRQGTVAAGGSLLVLAIGLWALGFPTYSYAGVAVLSALCSAAPVASAAWRALRLRYVDMNCLMVIAAAGALAVEDWFEAATAMFLFGVALWLESYSVTRAHRAVSTLVELMPKLAHRVRPSAAASAAAETSVEIDDVPPQSLITGDVVLIRPGERIPIDGQIIVGQSAVNEAPLTGESLPVEKNAGARVFAGSLNGESSLRVRATSDAEHSALSQVERLVEQARLQRSPTERFVDRFARFYTPAIIALALIVAVGVPLWLVVSGVDTGGTHWRDWIHRGLVLLVIACPCALVISTPVTIVCGLHQATRWGILVKGGDHLENAGRIHAVAWDKTGTITTGQITVGELMTLDDVDERALLASAAALELHSEHPLARAVVRCAQQRQLSWMHATDVTTVPGRGVLGNWNGLRYAVGSLQFFCELEWPLDHRIGEWAQQHADDAVVVVGNEQRTLGALRLCDQVRPYAAEAITACRQAGVRQAVMLTGDRQSVADRLAKEIGIDDVRAELLPADKIRVVKELSQVFPQLAMVGDGINDAPALAAARLGIAMGRDASDLALETADVVVLSPRLLRLPQLIELGQATRRILWQNISLALGIKLIVLGLAAMDWATMWMAVAADVGATVLVVSNGMRLLREVPGEVSGPSR